MKQMEYTLKIVTDGPIAAETLEDLLTGEQADGGIGVEGIVSATVTNFRVLPTKKAEKAGATS